jgi:hypothetical protein
MRVCVAAVSFRQRKLMAKHRGSPRLCLPCTKMGLRRWLDCLFRLWRSARVLGPCVAIVHVTRRAICVTRRAISMVHVASRAICARMQVNLRGGYPWTQWSVFILLACLMLRCLCDGNKCRFAFGCCLCPRWRAQVKYASKGRRR